MKVESCSRILIEHNFRDINHRGFVISYFLGGGAIDSVEIEQVDLIFRATRFLWCIFRKVRARYTAFQCIPSSILEHPFRSIEHGGKGRLFCHEVRCVLFLGRDLIRMSRVLHGIKMDLEKGKRKSLWLRKRKRL
jgi:hypothetical protein